MGSNIYMQQAFQGEAKSGVSRLRVRNLLSLIDKLGNVYRSLTNSISTERD